MRAKEKKSYRVLEEEKEGKSRCSLRILKADFTIYYFLL